MKKLYLDTNIYLDYLLERKNKKDKDLSEPSFRIFKRAIKCDFFIVVSDKILTELRTNIDPQKASILFHLLANKLVKVRTEKEDIEKAKKLPTHKNDALHIILAKKSSSDIIVTRNKKHFQSLFNTKLPEDIL